MMAFVGACFAGWPNPPRRQSIKSGRRPPAPTPIPDGRTAMHLRAANGNTPRALGRMIALLTAVTMTSSALLAALADQLQGLRPLPERFSDTRVGAGSGPSQAGSIREYSPTHKRYLYVAIDRASRFVHLAVQDDETTASAVAFLNEAVRAFPFQVTHVLTDRGSCFTADGFERVCEVLGVAHRKTRPYTPRTNGMVVRFNGRIQREVLGITVASHRDLETLLHGFIRPTTPVASACSRADHPRGSCASASAQPQPAPTAITIRRSIPAACPRPFRSSLVPRTSRILTSTPGSAFGRHCSRHSPRTRCRSAACATALGLMPT